MSWSATRARCGVRRLGSLRVAGSGASSPVTAHISPRFVSPGSRTPRAGRSRTEAPLTPGSTRLQGRGGASQDRGSGAREQCPTRIPRSRCTAPTCFPLTVLAPVTACHCPYTSDTLTRCSLRPAQKNGEKRLRRQLTRTPEWQSKQHRLAMADLADGMGADYAPLAAVMRGRANCSTLRKCHLLLLARAWAYTSCLWQRRRPGPGMPAAAAAGGAECAAASAPNAGGVKRKKAPVPAVTPPAPSFDDDALILPPMHCAPVPLATGHQLVPTLLMLTPAPRQDVRALHEFARLHLMPLGMDAATKFGGPNALRAIAQGGGGRFVTAQLVEEMSFAAAATTAVTAVLARMHKDAVAWHFRAVGAAAGTGMAWQPAWRVLAGKELECERMARLLQSHMSKGACFSRSRVEMALKATSPDAPEALNSTESTWLNEMYSAQQAGLEFLVKALACLAELKLAPLDECLQGSAVILDALGLMLRTSAAHMTRRAEGCRLYIRAAPEGQAAAPPLYRYFGRD